MMTGCSGKENPQPDVYDNLIVYGNIYTAKVDASNFSTNLPGYRKIAALSDFVILDKDILTCDAQVLKETKVLKTFFEGQEVYSAE